MIRKGIVIYVPLFSPSPEAPTVSPGWGFSVYGTPLAQYVYTMYT